MPKLTVENGQQQHAEFQFQNPIVIGRGGAVDFVLADPGVSRRHAMLRQDGRAWTVEDLGSGNGTFLNNRVVSHRSPLTDGDILRLGSILLKYEDTSEAPRPSDTTSVRVMDSAPSQILMRVPVVEEPRAGHEHTMFGSARRLRFLENMARISSMVFDERALMSFVVDELFEMMPQADRAFVMAWDPELNRLVPSAARTRSGHPAEIVASRTLFDDVLAKREAVLVLDAPSDQRYAQAKSMFALKISTAICAPIVFQDQVFGLIQVDSTSARSPFSRADVAMTLGVGSEVGMALAYARVHAQLVEQELLEHDLELARKIQHHFLPPHSPTIVGYGFDVEYRPALAVGGDLYDFIELGGGLRAVVIGDVSGKGVSAALYAAKLMTDLRYVSAGLTSPAAILSRVNDVLVSGDHEGMFVTAAMAVLDARTGRLTVASAGHPLPFARDRSGQVAALGQTGGSALGLKPGVRFHEHVYELDGGDVVVLFTDGVVEALNSRKEMFGEAKLIDALRRCDGSPSGAVRAIDRDVRAFAGSEPQSDDVTIVCFGRNR
jgi:serine phosphatase RsbU (regulator of sigma subunit)/pSer/pThr/pTyr-binding forkhead associated (FHA) protein